MSAEAVTPRGADDRWARAVAILLAAADDRKELERPQTSPRQGVSVSSATCQR
jgi:hypothetical protein